MSVDNTRLLLYVSWHGLRAKIETVGFTQRKKPNNDSGKKGLELPRNLRDTRSCTNANSAEKMAAKSAAAGITMQRDAAGEMCNSRFIG